MLHLLREGDKVKVWPTPGHSVYATPPSLLDTPTGPQMLPGRLLSADGEELSWTVWLAEMARSGALCFSDPTNYTRAVHVRHPHECGPDGKPAHLGGANSQAELAHWEALGHKGAKLAAAAPGKKE